MPSSIDTARPSETQVAHARFQRLGFDVRVMQGGRTVLARMPLGDAPFPGPHGATRISQALVCSVGANRIKCLRPSALFALPILDIRDCENAGDLEARIRAAWRERTDELGLARRWIESIGGSSTEGGDPTVLQLPIDGLDLPVEAAMIERGKVILPSRGPLAGVPLAGPEERTLRIDAQTRSAVDLEIAISNRLEALAGEEAQRREERRQLAMRAALSLAPAHAAEHTPRVLLVGPRLGQPRGASESLKLRGYGIHLARGINEAVSLLARISPDLVLADMQMGRAEGIELIVLMRELAGIEALPVVLVDESAREARREAARQVGAAGYLVHPLDVSRIAERIDRLARDPKRRRFTRFAPRVSVRVAGAAAPCIATAMSRGGMFLATDESLPANSLQRCELLVPELGRKLEVDAEVLYRVGNTGLQRRGVGVRFEHFAEGSEPALIDYLGSLAAGA